MTGRLEVRGSRFQTKILERFSVIVFGDVGYDFNYISWFLFRQILNCMFNTVMTIYNLKILCFDGNFSQKG